MISREIIEQLLTPERISALSREDKEEIFLILEALAVPRLERMARRMNRKNAPAQVAEEAVEAKYAEELEEWQEWRKQQAIREGLDPDELKRMLFAPGVPTVVFVRPNADGVPPDLRETVPPQQDPQPEREATSKPMMSSPRPSTATAWAAAKQESERVQKEAEEFQRTDFLTQICGTGYTRPSGTSNRRWNA